ncbi:hypothetical protein [Methylorubrum aminovorans]|uniref:hypothetical protein n=1 Tax=Methylorubrum aminovorans TaxID=269069 RepID=UPI003C2C1075
MASQWDGGRRRAHRNRRTRYFHPRPAAALGSGTRRGGGLRYAGTGPANEVRGCVRNATVTRFDAAAAYDLAKVDPRPAGMRRQVNVNNGFDRRYLECQAGGRSRGQVRPFTASLIDRW